MTDLYNCKTTRNGWRMTKFDENIDPVEGSSYEMHYMDGVLHCSCPAMARHTCRHRVMFPMFQLADKIDGTWFLEFNNKKDTYSWRQYVGPFEDASVPLDVTQGIETTFEQDVVGGNVSQQDLDADAACAANRDEDPGLEELEADDENDGDIQDDQNVCSCQSMDECNHREGCQIDTNEKAIEGMSDEYLKGIMNKIEEQEQPHPPVLPTPDPVVPPPSDAGSGERIRRRV